MPRLVESLILPSCDRLQAVNFLAAKVGVVAYTIDLMKTYLDGEPQLVRVAMGMGAITVTLTSILLESRLNIVRDRNIVQSVNASSGQSQLIS